jgi:hypothetical protein
VVAAAKRRPLAGNYSSTSQLILALIIIVDNMEKSQANSHIHSISIRYRYNLHVPHTDLSKCQKGVYYSGIKLFSKLPPNNKI